MTFSELIRSVAGSFVPHKAGQQPRQEAQAQQPSPAPEALEADVYRPNPEWTRVNVSVQSRHNASILAPKCLEEAKQAADVLNKTTDPDTFFRKYDYLLGRFVILAECTKYTRFGGEQPTVTLARLYRQSYRNHVGKAMIDRCFARAQDKLALLAKPKDRLAAVEAFQKAFEPCLGCMGEELCRYQAEKYSQLTRLAAGEDLSAPAASDDSPASL